MKRNYPFGNVATNKTDQRWALLNTHKSPIKLPQMLMGALAPGSVYFRPRQTSVTLGQITEQRVKNIHINIPKSLVSNGF